MGSLRAQSVACPLCWRSPWSRARACRAAKSLDRIGLAIAAILQSTGIPAMSLVDRELGRGEGVV